MAAAYLSRLTAPRAKAFGLSSPPDLDPLELGLSTFSAGHVMFDHVSFEVRHQAIIKKCCNRVTRAARWSNNRDMFSSCKRHMATGPDAHDETFTASIGWADSPCSRSFPLGLRPLVLTPGPTALSVIRRTASCRRCHLDGRSYEGRVQADGGASMMGGGIHERIPQLPSQAVSGLANPRGARRAKKPDVKIIGPRRVGG